MPVNNMMLDFSDLSGGKNSAQPRHAIGQNQCVDTVNLIHERIGVVRAPGFKGTTDTQQFDYPMRGLFTFVMDDGTERLIVTNNGKLYNASFQMSFYPAACPINNKYYNAPNFDVNMYASISAGTVLSPSGISWSRQSPNFYSQSLSQTINCSKGYIKHISNVDYSNMGFSLSFNGMTFFIHSTNSTYYIGIWEFNNGAGSMLGVKLGSTTLYTHASNITFPAIISLLTSIECKNSLAYPNNYTLTLSCTVKNQSGVILYDFDFVVDNISVGDDANYFTTIMNSSSTGSGIISSEWLSSAGATLPNSCRGNIYSDFSFSGAASV